MTVNIDVAIEWMKEREGKVSYSMDFRDGPDSYDCSSSVYYSLMSAGAISAGWAVNTEYEHDWLIKNGYTLISENAEWNAQRGDIFIWGRHGQSAGAFGHTGMFVDDTNIIHCNYAHDGISVNDYDSIWLGAGQPYFYVYRLTNTEIEIVPGWKQTDTGYWYVREDGSYPKEEWEKIDGTWYYFNERGYSIASRWLKDDGKWYYLKENGAMAVGWVLVNGKWYYLDASGAMVTGWVQYKDKLYHLKEENGEMSSKELVKVEGGWYYVNEDGSRSDKPALTVLPDGLIVTTK